MRDSRLICRSTAVALLLALGCSIASAENWPEWRGPSNNGISKETGIPVKWSKTENVAWKTPLPGPAGATPVIWEDRIFLTAADESSGDGNDLVLMCISTEGKPLWKQVVGRGNHKARGDEGNAASPSPCTDGEHVWSFMGNGSLGCYTLDGKEVWNFDVQDRYGKFQIQFGMTSTPVLHGENLYLQLIHGDGKAATREATIVALEKRTGKEVWKQGRDSDAYAENEHSYASPIIYDDGRLAFLVTHGADLSVAHRLDDGTEIWRCGGLNVKSKYDPTLRFVASPAAVPGMIVLPSAKRGPVIAVRPEGQGDITNEEKYHHWTRSIGGDVDLATPDVPSPLIVDGLVYLCMANGNIALVEAESGKQLYYERGHRIRHRASPVYADGHVYLTGRDGLITVVKAGREFEIVAQNEIGEDMSSSPVISNGTLYLRSFGHLWAIRK